MHESRAECYKDGKLGKKAEWRRRAKQLTDLPHVGGWATVDGARVRTRSAKAQAAHDKRAQRRDARVAQGLPASPPRARKGAQRKTTPTEGKDRDGTTLRVGDKVRVHSPTSQYRNAVLKIVKFTALGRVTLAVTPRKGSVLATKVAFVERSAR